MTTRSFARLGLAGTLLRATSARTVDPGSSLKRDERSRSGQACSTVLDNAKSLP